MSKEAMKLALEVLNAAYVPADLDEQREKAITAIKQALEQPVQEPVATIDSLEQEIYENTREFVSLNVMEWLLKRLNTTPLAQPAPVQPVDGTQVSKVWWDGEKLMAKPIPLEDIYQPVQEPWNPSDTAHRPGGLPQDFTKHEVDLADAWSEWVCPASAQYFMKCCDCGLVHEMQFKVAKYSEGDECAFVEDADLQAVFRARRATPPAAQPAPVQEPVGVFVEDDDIGHVRLIPHQQLKLKDGDKLYTTPPAAQPVPVQEPVAFVHNETGLLRQANRAKGGDFEPRHWTPLYTTPPAQPAVQEPLGYLEIDDIESQREYPHNCRNINLWHEGGQGMAAIYTTPPAAQRPWVGLTDEEMNDITCGMVKGWVMERLAIAIEAKLKEKNNG